MKLIPLYFFLALFIGFFIVYAFKNDHHLIIKNKKQKECADGTFNCYNL